MQEQTDYQQAFPRDTHIIGCFFNQLISTKTYQDFYRIVASNLIPSILKEKRLDAYLKKYAKWRSDINLRYDNNAKQAVADIVTSFVQLKDKLRQQNIIDVMGWESYRYLDHFLNLNSDDQLDILDRAYTEFKSLCCSLNERGERNIIQQFGTLQYFNVRGIQQEDFAPFTFAPSMDELDKINKIFIWESIDQPLLVFEIFNHINECYYDHNGRHNHQTRDRCSWPKYSIGKKMHFGQEDWITLDLLKKYAIVLANDLLVHLTGENAHSSIYALELKLCKNELQLEVHRDKLGSKDTYKMHKFHHDSQLMDTVACLIENPGVYYDIKRIGTGDDRLSNAKFLERIKCSKNIAKYLFNKGRKTLSLNENPIKFKDGVEDAYLLDELNKLEQIN